MTKHEEVVIDGDSTEEEDEDDVAIITPHLRKRRRRSNIMWYQDGDEEDGGEGIGETELEVVNDKAFSSSKVPQRQQQLQLTKGMISSGPMTLRTTTLRRRPHRRMHQLSMLAAVTRGQNERLQQVENDEGEEKDEVQIVSPPSSISVSNSGIMNRPLAIEDSDEEIGKQQNCQQKVNNEVETASSKVRRISQICHKKNEQHTCKYNSLDILQDGKDGYDRDEHSSPPKKRRQSVPRVGELDYREKEYEDNGDDVDDFICGDDEIEYMEDDEEETNSVESSDDESEEDRSEELSAVLAAGRSREVHEWFNIYMEYLEECIIDPNLDNLMRRKRSKAKYQLYEQAIRCIERKLCSCRDTVRSGLAWPDELVDALKYGSLFLSSHVSIDQDCDACNRRQHFATYHAELAGYACDATKLYNSNWMRYLKEAATEAAPVESLSFNLGSVCHARTLAYWQLLHAKQFWCILIDAKRKSCTGDNGRIADAYRNDFFKKEFGRFKKLVGLVEIFAEDSKRLTYDIPNAWKKIMCRNGISDLFPRVSQSRQGTLDAFVDDSEVEGFDDEEELMKQIEKDKCAVTYGDNDDKQASDDDEEAKNAHSVLCTKRQTLYLESKKKLKSHFACDTRQNEGELQLQDNQTTSEKDIDDLMCLVCHTNSRNAGVVHGLYLHVYCCYACAKRQHQQKAGCMVCNRPIDSILRLLPLTIDVRKAIQNQQTMTTLSL
ncbi:putative Zinc finger, RING/FYVE/PHD-type [Plasmopara halstedii]